MSRFQGKTHSKHDDVPQNEYEQQRLKTIEANKLKMKTLGIKRIAASMTSLVDSTKAKKRQQKCKATLEKVGDYVPEEDPLEDECENEADSATITTKAKSNETKERGKKNNFIPPMSLAKLLRTNKKKQPITGKKSMEFLSTTINESTNAAMCNQQRTDDGEYNADFDEDIRKFVNMLDLENVEEQIIRNNEEFEMNETDQEDIHVQDIMTNYDGEIIAHKDGEVNIPVAEFE